MMKLPDDFVKASWDYEIWVSFRNIYTALKMIPYPDCLAQLAPPQDQELHVDLSVDMLKNGTVDNIDIAVSSGVEDIDNAVVAHCKQSLSQFQALPEIAPEFLRYDIGYACRRPFFRVRTQNFVMAKHSFLRTHIRPLFVTERFYDFFSRYATTIKKVEGLMVLDRDGKLSHISIIIPELESLVSEELLDLIKAIDFPPLPKHFPKKLHIPYRLSYGDFCGWDMGAEVSDLLNPELV